MATFWIEEEPSSPLAGRGVVPVHELSKGNTKEQDKTISGTSQQSDAFGDNTGLVTIHADAECYFDFGTNPVAKSTTPNKTKHLISGQYRTFNIPRGQSWKVAVKGTT